MRPLFNTVRQFHPAHKCFEFDVNGRRRRPGIVYRLFEAMKVRMGLHVMEFELQARHCLTTPDKSLLQC